MSLVPMFGMLMNSISFGIDDRFLSFRPLTGLVS